MCCHASFVIDGSSLIVPFKFQGVTGLAVSGLHRSCHHAAGAHVLPLFPHVALGFLTLNLMSHVQIGNTFEWCTLLAICLML